MESNERKNMTDLTDANRLEEAVDDLFGIEEEKEEEEEEDTDGEAEEAS